MNKRTKETIEWIKSNVHDMDYPVKFSEEQLIKLIELSELESALYSDQLNNTGGFIGWEEGIEKIIEEIKSPYKRFDNYIKEKEETRQK